MAKISSNDDTRALISGLARARSHLLVSSLVEPRQFIKHSPARSRVDSRGVRKEQNGVPAFAESDALMLTREESAPPQSVEQRLSLFASCP